jgi:SAM-dependent methyltransferase
MLSELLVRVPAGRRLVLRLGRTRSLDILDDLSTLLPRHGRILDIGAGSCDVASRLVGAGHDVTPLDVRDLSCVDGLTPVLYDGVRIPFEAARFDLALLINVLHHVDRPELLLSEAARVATRVVVQEDIYSSRWQRFVTLLMDSALNLEFIGHPHQNRDDAGWRAAFAALGLTLEEARYKTFWRFFSSATYALGTP